MTRTTKDIEISDERDQDGEVYLSLTFDTGVFINKDDAIKIISHLQKIFELKPN